MASVGDTPILPLLMIGTVIVPSAAKTAPAELINY